MDAPTYMDRPIADMSREELIAAVAHLLERLEETSGALLQVMEANKPNLNRHQRRAAAVN